MLALSALSGLQCARHHSAVGDDGEMFTFANDLGLAKRNRILGARIDRAAIGFAIEALVFQKQNRIVAANRRTQQTRSI